MKTIKKILQPDDSCEGCIYEGTSNCQLNQVPCGNTLPCVEVRDIDPNIYYIYVEEDEDEDSN